MLIENSTIKNGDTVTLKMVGGDEIVAKLIDEGSDSVTVTKPLLVMMAQQGFGLMPYVLTANPEKDYILSKEHIIVFTKTLDEVSKEYIKQTTGLHI